MPEITETFFARDRARWRAWLAKHHATKKEIWLTLLKKHVKKPSVTYDEAVEEALCFGWIDGILKRIDDEKHVTRFTPRSPKSVWSEINKKRVQRMVRAGKMTDAGKAAVEAGKKSGQWQKAYSREKTQPIPEDLERALRLGRNRRAREHFERFTTAQQQGYVRWVLDAKRDDTRQRRVREVVKRAAANRRPGIDM